MEVLVDLWQVVARDHPGIGIAIGAVIALLLIAWGVRASAY